MIKLAFHCGKVLPDAVLYTLLDAARTCVCAREGIPSSGVVIYAQFPHNIDRLNKLFFDTYPFSWASVDFPILESLHQYHYLVSVNSAYSYRCAKKHKVPVMCIKTNKLGTKIKSVNGKQVNLV